MNDQKIYAKRLWKLNPSKINGQPSRRLQKGKQNIILPLEDGTNKIRFEETDKSIILENTFFGGHHLKDEQFDSQCYDEIMEEYINICNETNKQEMEDPKCNEYITM
jgi:hypothetical protein